MRSIFVGSLSCLALLTSLGCSSKAGDPSVKEDVGGFPIPDAPAHAQPLSLDQYCDAKAQVSCHSDVPCCATAGMPQPEAQCLSAVRAKCLDEVATEKGKGHVFDPKSAGICVLGGASLLDGCTVRTPVDDAGYTANTLVSDACHTVWRGTVAVGGDCTESGDCAIPDVPGAQPVCAFSSVGSVVTHQCKVWNAAHEGEACADSFSCMRGTYCDSGTCHAYRAPKKRGEACAYGDTCEAGSWCRDGMCGEGLGAGEDCLLRPRNCAAPLGCKYGLGASAVCGEKPRIGESCRQGFDQCVDGAQCGASACVAIVPLGAACTESAQCAMVSQVCRDGVCAARNDVGSVKTCTAIAPSPPEPPLTTTPAPTPRIVSVSRNTACAIVAGGGVTCWGSEFGTAAITGPKPVAGVTGAAEIATGDGFACLRTAEGTVSCWGSVGYGELGQAAPDRCGYDGTQPCAKKPIAVPGITSAVKVVATSGRVCALLADGTISCWGRRDGSSTDVVAPTPLPGITNAVDVALASGSVLGITSAGYVKEWKALTGKPTWLLTKDGAYEQSVVAIAPAGFGPDSPGTIVLHADGSVSGAPVGLPAAIDVASGEGFACAVTSEGAVQCWGGNGYGQLGLGETSRHASDFLSTVRGVANAAQVSASMSGNTACALTSTGVYCWGDNFDQLVGPKFDDHGPRKVL